ncbi:DUF445 domain-containing protein [Neobacillus vireti]|uniref:DUF445 domain-containing protein n=1 Tax=Neobacillus vireti LMG 21834 TaxID=1131730 RepID=A0AB94IKV4_9BACI|nr:DUF445 domain-containing protein [Neobacillus vireti]ETI67623.1 hypothetical protein BAVI_16587 [Neobacillus vireti LMG 21834]KLT19131.1 hypothetical protein AA980_00530 [Neobacillus vireti]
MLKQKSKSQHLAAISLIVMAAGFIATIPIPQSLWKTILQGGFEAGLVGGLADWFAVTALFRHPMGLPIPHTALLPKNREKIIAKIISMVEQDWLTKESIREKIDTFQFSEKLFSIVNKEIHAQPVKKNIITLIQHLIKKIEIKMIAPILEKELKTFLENIDINYYFPLLVDQITIRKYDEKTLDFILKEIDDWAQKESTKQKLGGMAVEMIENIKADGFMQFALRSFSNLVNEEKLGHMIQNLILKGVDSYRDPFNQNRQTLLSHINNKLQTIKRDEKIYEELNQFKLQIIANWKPAEKIIDFLSEFQQKAHDFVEEPSFYDEYILPLVIKSLNEFKENPDKTKQLEAWVKKQISSFVDRNHSKIGILVKENLDKLDTKTLINMIETNVGKDLQWIRVNGAVCGFLIGLILVGIKALF